MTVDSVLSPYLALPGNLRNVSLEYSLILLVADHFRINERDVGHRNRPRNAYDGFVAMPFLDGRIEPNVAKTAKRFMAKGLPVFVVVTGRVITRPLLQEFEMNHHSGLFTLRVITAKERLGIAINDPFLIAPNRG